MHGNKNNVINIIIINLADNISPLWLYQSMIGICNIWLLCYQKAEYSTAITHIISNNFSKMSVEIWITQWTGSDKLTEINKWELEQQLEMVKKH